MRIAVTIVSAAVGLVAVSCAAYIKLSGSVPSADESMRLAVVDWIGPGQREREHKLFIGVGDKDDNPAVKYFKGERTYRLANELEWNAEWISNDLIRMTTYECSTYKGLRKYPDPECRELDTFELARSGPGATFHEVAKGGRS